MTWISVKDRLPEEWVRVLSINIKSTSPEIKVDYIVHGSTQSVWACRLYRDEDMPTHWMALPQPPGE